MYKVSVIVPIYNVQKYLRRCIDSILNQTYKNLEIILINDGSTDNSGKIIDEYKQIDNRIKVYHQENKGLSDTRNYGTKIATGDFILYLDSDDWADINMINIMIEKIEEYNADIVQVGFYYNYEEYLLYDNRFYEENDTDIVLGKQELMKELVINKRVKNFTWGKLYKSELVKDILFKKDVRFEDVFWAHKVMDRVDKYVIVHKPLMYYLQRSESISGSYKVENTDIIKGLLERHLFIKENYNNLEDESYKLILKTCFMHYDMLLKIKDDKSKKYIKWIEKYICDNYNSLKDAVDNDKSMKKELIYFKINPFLRILYVYYSKVLRKLKIKKSEPSLKRIELNEKIC